MPSGEGRRSLQGSTGASGRVWDQCRLGCRKKCLIENIRGGSPTVPGNPARGCLPPLEDEGLRKARPPSAAHSLYSSLSVFNLPFPWRESSFLL